ncbi:hypothetical protein [Streptomyces mirabilis]|uniref:hypothetical protein n=1 Tax=Streptomyces mirabilis TaxID=68239 RepID=UPI0036DE542C
MARAGARAGGLIGPDVSGTIVATIRPSGSSGTATPGSAPSSTPGRPAALLDEVCAFKNGVFVRTYSRKR